MNRHAGHRFGACEHRGRACTAQIADKPFEVSSLAEPLSVTISIGSRGYGMGPTASGGSDEARRQGAYEAKNSGRNRVVAAAA